MAKKKIDGQDKGARSGSKSSRNEPPKIHARGSPKHKTSNSASKSNPYFYVAAASSVLVLFFAVVLTFLGADKSGGLNRNSVQGIKKHALSLPCKDRENGDNCARMAFEGHCDTSPGWMNVMCSASCNACEMLDPNIRCDYKRLNLTMKPAYLPGEMDDMFEHLPERYPQYNVTYLSRPPDGPYVVQFDNFLSDREIDALLKNVGILKRSTDQGDFDADGYQNQVVSKGRTSENAWCMNECERDPIVKGVQKRISDIIKVPTENFENFQMLRYEIGQEYVRHHDMSPETGVRPAGPRILTFFLYLSNVEAGGGTRFTELDLTMIPKRGSAILWPSVYSDDLMRQHQLTYHQALPVEKGTKYAANSWIHLYDYKTPNFHGCTGSFM